jgi:hypothetical protein
MAALRLDVQSVQNDQFPPKTLQWRLLMVSYMSPTVTSCFCKLIGNCLSPENACIAPMNARFDTRDDVASASEPAASMTPVGASSEASRPEGP